MNPRLYSVYLKLLLVYISQEDMKALGRNIIEVFEGFASQKGLKIFTSSFTFTKLVEKKFCYMEESFHGATAGLVMCMMMIIQKHPF